MAALRLEQLDGHLARELRPLLRDPRRRAAACRSRPPTRSAAQRARSGFSERVVLTAERGFDWGELAASAASISLFGDAQADRAAHPLRQAGRRRRRAIEAFCARLPPDALTLVTLPRRGPRRPVVLVVPGARARGERSSTSSRSSARGFPSGSPPGSRGRSSSAKRRDPALPRRLRRGESPRRAPGDPEARAAPAAGRARLRGRARSGDERRALRRRQAHRGDALGRPRAARAHARRPARRRRSAAARAVAARRGDPRRLPRAGRHRCRAGRSRDVLREARVWGDARQVARRTRRAANSRAARCSPRSSTPRRVDRVVKGIAKGDAWDELLQLGLRFAA